MRIYLEEEEIYNGEFIEDLSKYLTEGKKYKFVIINNRKYVETKIVFKLSIS